MSTYVFDERSEDGAKLTFEDVEWMAENTDLPPHIIVFLHELVLRREQGRPLELPPPSEPEEQDESEEPEYLGGDEPLEDVELGEELTLADLQWFEAHPDCPPYVVETLARVIAEREKRRGEELAQPPEAEPEDVPPTEPVSAPGSEEGESGEGEPEGVKPGDPPPPDEGEPEEGAEEPQAPEEAEQGGEDDDPEAGAEPSDGESQLPLEPEDDPPGSADGEGEEPDGGQGDADEPSGPQETPGEGDVIITPGALELADEEGFDLSGLIEARQAE
ncbi:MAG TPA: hypothetical protein VG518_08575, partial [Solirubrobacterales bacterium]|nr:hypothetical protein [Solirubrobacterales bacterium]